MVRSHRVTLKLVAWRERIGAFLSPTESDSWLTYLRIGLGVAVVFYSLSLRDDWNYFFGGSSQALVGRELAEKILSLDSSIIPRIGWLVAVGTHLGSNENMVLSIVWTCLLCAGCGLLLGVLPRFWAANAWLIHLSAAKSGEFVSYGLDNFMTIGLFYLILAPLPDRYCLDRQWRRLWSNFGRLTPAVATERARSLGFWRRALQFHLCLIYFFSGLTKCLGSGWWDGSNLWRALIRPPFNTLPPEMLMHWKYAFPVAGLAIALIELSYPCFIWRRQTRIMWLAAICAMHGIIGLAMGMYLFALVMVVLNLAAFAPAVCFSKIFTRAGRIDACEAATG